MAPVVPLKRKEQIIMATKLMYPCKCLTTNQPFNAHGLSGICRVTFNKLKAVQFFSSAEKKGKKELLPSKVASY